MTKNEKVKQWRKENPDKVKEHNAKSYKKNNANSRASHDRWIDANKAKNRQYKRNWWQKKQSELKDRLFSVLGDKCVRCGFKDKRALCIDHKNGGGFKELRSGISVVKYYEKVIADVGENYQILCHNCNWIKRHENNEVRQPNPDTMKLMEQDKKALVNEIKKVVF